MRGSLAALLVSAALVATAGAVSAHHSFAMFDQQNPIDIEGTVKEFRYISPHVYIFLDVKSRDGNVTTWNLEGGAPSLLVRDGWTSKSIKPGDELWLKIDPLHSGAPGGAWNVMRIKFKDGRPIVQPTQ
jgi:hypothetical protein